MPLHCLLQGDAEQFQAIRTRFWRAAREVGVPGEEQRIFRFLPLSLKIETLGGIASPLVRRGTPLPAKRVHIFTTAADNQESIEVHILLGESPLAQKCQSLGKFHLKGIPPAPRGKPEVKVSFEVNEACEIHATAGVKDSPLEASSDLVPLPAYVADEAIKRLRAEVDQKEDQRKVSLIEARNRAEMAIREAEGLLASYRDGKAPGLDADGLDEKIAALGQALEADDAKRIGELTEQVRAGLTRPSILDDVFGDISLNNIFGSPPVFPTFRQPARRSPTTGGQRVTREPTIRPEKVGRTPSEAMATKQSVSEVTRRTIIDYLAGGVEWWGSLSENEFLARLYDLTKLPSNDPRYQGAARDILQHRVAFHDWPDDWVFFDPRFKLLYASDDEFLRFLCETVHPVVRLEGAQEVVDAYNSALKVDGWKLVESTQISGRPVYRAVRLDGRIEVFEEPTGWEKVDRQLQEIRLRLDTAQAEEHYQEVGLLCREALISVAEAAFDPSRHVLIDEAEPSKTDARRMLESFFEGELRGSSNEEARVHARAALKLAVALQHRRTADWRMAALCSEATASVINIVAILSGRRG